MSRNTVRRLSSYDMTHEYPAGAAVVAGNLVSILAGEVVPGETAGAIALGRACTDAVEGQFVRVEQGIFRWTISGAIVSADIGKPCYVVDGTSVKLTDAGTDIPAGFIYDVGPDGVDVLTYFGMNL